MPAINAASMLVTKGALGHIVLNVADLKKSERFYHSILGLKVSARNLQTKMTFMSYGREHHDIALQALPKGTEACQRQRRGQAASFLYLRRSQRTHR
jgi:catechol-2,3-dioxygenase